MLKVPANYASQGNNNRDKRKRPFFKSFKRHGVTVTHSDKGLPKVSREYGKLARYSLIVMDIGYLRAYFEHSVISTLEEHQLGTIHQEAVYDYMVMNAFKEATLDFRIELAGMYRHDIYDLVYEQHKDVYVQAMVKLIKDQGVTFLNGDTPKVMVTGQTMILARSFNATF